MCLFPFELKMSRVVFTLAAVILKDEQVNIVDQRQLTYVLVPPLAVQWFQIVARVYTY